MRTTVRLPDELLRAVREPLPTYAGKGLQPGVDLTDSNALDDLMTGR